LGELLLRKIESYANEKGCTRLFSVQRLSLIGPSDCTRGLDSDELMKGRMTCLEHHYSLWESGKNCNDEPALSSRCYRLSGNLVSGSSISMSGRFLNMTKVPNLNRLVLALLMLLAGSICVPAQESVTRRRQVVSSVAPEADITINEQFANSFLDAIFDNLKEPSVTLNRGISRGNPVAKSVAVLKREVGGVRTAVHFDSGRIMAPLAFAGSYYSSLLGCIQFEGSATR